MKKIRYLLLCGFAATTLFSSCDKNGPNTTAVSLTVTNGLTGTVVADATVKLYVSPDGITTGAAPDYTVSTDATGKIKVAVDYTGIYYVVVEKGTAKNFYDGLIPVGIFKTQADIDNNPTQTPPAVIGAVRFQDTDHDGTINSSDKIVAPTLFLNENIANSFAITIY